MAGSRTYLSTRASIRTPIPRAGYTTHKLQPLDVGVFGPFSRAWLDRCDEYVDEYDEEMPREDFVKEYMAIRAKTFKAQTIMSAFKKCGIRPLDRGIFDDEDFAPSITTSTTDTHVPPSFPISDTPRVLQPDFDSDEHCPACRDARRTVVRVRPYI